MFNISGKYVKVWAIEIKGNMCLVDLSTSKKEQDGSYTKSNYYKVRFVGKCAPDATTLNKGDTIEIKNGLIGKREYNGKYYDSLVVFDFEITQRAEQKQDDFAGFESIEDDETDDMIPF